MLRTFIIKWVVRKIICGKWNPLPPYGKRRSFGWKGRLAFKIERLFAKLGIIEDFSNEYDFKVDYRDKEGKLKQKL